MNVSIGSVSNALSCCVHSVRVGVVHWFSPSTRESRPCRRGSTFASNVSLCALSTLTVFLIKPGTTPDQFRNVAASLALVSCRGIQLNCSNGVSS